MDSQRYVNLAYQQGLVSVQALKEAQAKQREDAKQGGNISVWDVLQADGIISPEKAKDVESSMDSTQHGLGIKVEDYILQERIGSGGMGDVYLGVPENGEGDQVAVKIMPSRLCSDPEHFQRFVRETRALSQLEDEHFTGFIGSGQIDSRPYLIMELVRGMSLRERLLQQGALRQHEAIALLVQLSGALIKAEDSQLVHRDIKPANILIAPARYGKDEPFCAKICDFGLVKFLQDRAESMGADGDLTISGIALGTPHYMSPEQATGEREIDHRSDMYSLAASVYHTMIGRTLFSGKTSAVIMYKQVTAAIDVEPLRDRGCGDELIGLLRDMLHKEPSERPVSWRDVYARSVEISDHLPEPTALPASQGSISGATSQGDDTTASPIAGMPLGIYRARQRTVRGMALFLGVCVVLLAALSWMIWPPGIQQIIHQVTPQTISEQLDVFVSEPPVAASHIFVLAPGRYSEPLRLSAGHAGLEIRAQEVGVILDTGDIPAIELEPGVTGVQVTGGVTIRGRGRTPIVLGSESSLLLDDVQIEHSGRIFLNQGKLELRNVTASSTIEAQDAELQLTNVVMNGLYFPFTLRDSVFIADSLYVEGALNVEGALMSLINSSARLNSVTLQGANAHTGLFTDNCSWLEMTDVSINGRYRAWNSRDSQAVSIQYVSLQADRLGISWEGTQQPQWQWSELKFMAAQDATGIDIDGTIGSGAREDKLPADP